MILLSTSYFPPISYIRSIVESNEVLIEQYESFQKKTYRNRCSIYAANGVINLSVPIEKSNGKNPIIKDTIIDYSTNWQKQHFKSLESAYKSSPFYEYIIDDFSQFFTKKYKYLLDFNYDILKQLLDFLEIKKDIKFTDFYYKDLDSGNDLRYLVNKKKLADCRFVNKFEYHQVFCDKLGFYEDLSIIDLIFNLGNESYSYLINN